jgi:TPR repeat protein
MSITNGVKVARNGVEIGEYLPEAVPVLLSSGTLLLSDHYWKPGMSGWLLLSQFPMPQGVPPPMPGPATHSAPSSAPKKGVVGRIAWLFAGFFMPYFFAWRIIFDRAYGFSSVTKVFYACWTALIFVMMMSPIGGSSERYSQSDAEYRASLKARPYDVDSDQERPKPYTWAIGAAEQLIRGKLKSPSSAKFSPYKETSRRKTYDDGAVQYYVVSGWVESQNSFGAMLRSDYTICIKGTEDSTKIGISYLSLGEQVTGEVPVECKSAFSYPEEDAFFKRRMALAEKGDPVAQYDVGTCFEKAKGTKVDMAAAQMWFRKSGEQGNADAAFAVGLGYTLGSGVERDPVLAVTWYKKAAYGGHAFAQQVLANQYTTGNGIEKDLAEAYALYSLAIAMGANDGFGTVNFASKNLADLEKEITPADVEKGKRRMAELRSIIEAGKKK